MSRITVVSFLLMGCIIINVDDFFRAQELERSEGFWEINGTRLHYVIMGHGDPIVVLHGGPGGNLVSKLELAAFAPGFRWVFFDQRGCGESNRFPIDLEHIEDAEAFFGLDRYVEDIEAIRNKLGLERITLLGHSWGGALAVFYAAAHPERVEKLIVYNGGPVWPEIRAAKKQALRERSGPEVNSQVAELITRIGENIEIWDQDLLDAEFIKMISIVIPAYYCHPIAPLSPDEVGRGGFWANQLTNNYIQEFDRAAFALELSKVNAPALITYGRCEPNPPERQTYLRDAIPNSVMVVFDKSGHNAHLEQPELFGHVLRAFLLGDQLPLEPYYGEASDLCWSAKRG